MYVCILSNTSVSVHAFHCSRGTTGPALPSTNGGQGRSVRMITRLGLVSAAFSNSWGRVVIGSFDRLYRGREGLK
jgi:hypothetical protein